MKGLVSAGLILLIFGVVIPSFASYGDIASAFGSISQGWVIVLLASLLLIEILKAASPAVIIEDLGLFQSFVAEEASGAVSNTIPGPSGTATRFAIYLSWGISVEDFSLATVMNSIWNNLVILLMPIVALVLLATSDVDASVVFWLCVTGVVLAVVGIIVLVLVMRSERLAYRVGDWTGRVATRVLGWVRLGPIEDFGDTMLKFRTDTIDTFHRVKIRLTLVVLARYVATFMLLFFALRALGVDRQAIDVMAAFGAYAVVRLATMIEVTPGGIGVNDVLYITALTAVAPAGYDTQITAAVMLFRGFTYVGPIIIGGLCYLLWSSTDNWKIEKYRTRVGETDESDDLDGKARRRRRRRRRPANPQV